MWFNLHSLVRFLCRTLLGVGVKVPDDKFDEKRLQFKEFYGENISRLESAKYSIVSLLNFAFPTITSPQISSVERRIKDRNECIEKFKRKHQEKLNTSDTTYAIQDPITDLIGIRIVCLYEDSIPIIKNMLEEIFDIIDVTDKISEIEGTEASFGYKGLHLDVKLNASRISLPEYSRFADLRFEIQLRTVIQDSWSVFDHRIKYKKSIPQDLKRRINTLAALFELADHEFLATRDKTIEEANKPESDYESIAKETPTDDRSKKAAVVGHTPLDVFSFLKIASHFFPESEFKDVEVDDFVQTIVNLQPEVSRGKFNFYLKTNIATAKKVAECNYPSEFSIKDYPLPIMKLSLFIAEPDTFGEFVGPKTRAKLIYFTKGIHEG